MDIKTIYYTEKTKLTNKKKKIKYLIWNLSDEIKIHANQQDLLNNIENNELPFCKLAKKHIQIKHNSYQYQDKLKSKYNPELFISFDKIISKLKESELLCHYCHLPVYILYDVAFENNQWTLDRIDNTLGHNNDNVIISCLKCNLERRLQNKEKFDYSKNMVITKLDSTFM